MTDIVHYKLPFWFLGDIAQSLFVRKQVRNIFKFRFIATEKRFGKWSGKEDNLILEG
jgi:hypothetical protein